MTNFVVIGKSKHQETVKLSNTFKEELHLEEKGK